MDLESDIIRECFGIESIDRNLVQSFPPKRSRDHSRQPANYHTRQNRKLYSAEESVAKLICKT